MNLALRSALFGTLIALAILNHAHAQALDYLHRAEEAAGHGDGLAAIQLFQSAIIYAPATPEPYIGIAGYYSANGQTELAEKYFDIALEMDPANPPALRGLALIALGRGDIAGAEARHRILVEACAPICPEAAEVQGAINSHAPSVLAVE
jgi:Flp pilus assembly protein TadD